MTLSHTAPTHRNSRTERGNRSSSGESQTVEVPANPCLSQLTNALCRGYSVQAVCVLLSRSDAENMNNNYCFPVKFIREIPLRASGKQFAGGVWHAELERLDSLATAVRPQTGNNFEHAPLPADHPKRWEKRDGATSHADALNRKAVTVAACSTTFRANGRGECALAPTRSTSKQPAARGAWYAARTRSNGLRAPENVGARGGEFNVVNP